MNQTMLWKHYTISSILKISICFERTADELERVLKPFQAERSEPFDVKIFLCQESSGMTADGKRISGKYKGVLWSALLKDREEGGKREIFFWSAGFVSFLTLRVILIPLLRETLVQSGGDEFTGSAFAYHGKTFALLGLPGNKKTKLTLQAVEKGAAFVGDDEIIISKDRQIISFLNDLELRYDTVAGTDFWNSLSLGRKIWLWSYRLIALFTFGKVSFNIVLNPAELGISSAAIKNEKIIFIILGKFQKISPVSAQEVIAMLLGYEKDYERCYGALFRDADSEMRRKQVLTRLFTGCSLWFVPRETKIDELFQLS